MGDVLKCFLDADFGPETFDVTGPWWGFELQHVKEDCCLIAKWCTSSVDRSEEEVLGREKELWRRIGLAQLGELLGKRTNIGHMYCLSSTGISYPLASLPFCRTGRCWM